MKRVVAAMILLVAACGDDGATPTTTASTSTSTTTSSLAAPAVLEPIEHADAANDCRFSFTEGSTDCGPGTDILSVHIDPSGPVVLTIEVASEPHFDEDFQWLVEFSVSDLACGLTNTESTDDGLAGSDSIGPYGYRVLTNEDAPPGTCDGNLEGTTATLIYNIQAPLGPWSVVGGTQRVETANLDDQGSSDDVAVEVRP